VGTLGTCVDCHYWEATCEGTMIGETMLMAGACGTKWKQQDQIVMARINVVSKSDVNK